jgi:hypothetical protein
MICQYPGPEQKNKPKRAQDQQGSPHTCIKPSPHSDKPEKNTEQEQDYEIAQSPDVSFKSRFFAWKENQIDCI